MKRMLIIKILFLFSCTNGIEINKEENKNTLDSVAVKKMINNVYDNNSLNACTDTIILLSDFPSFPFGIKYLTRGWILRYFNISRKELIFKARRNNIDTTFVDSIFILETTRSKIQFNTGGYNPKDSSLFINWGDIQDSSVILDKGIRIGIKKDMFFQNLNINNVNRNCDTIFMVDEEWQCYHKFYFSNDTLNRIVLEFME